MHRNACANTLQLQYVFTWPAYRPRTVLLVTCVFAMAYITLGNMAGNCLIFGIRVFEAANVPASDHAVSRRGGIWLGNLLAVIKVLMLLLIIITGICAWAGAFNTPNSNANSVSQNLAVSHSFANPSNDSYGYAQAFLAVIFAWSGFDQPNYVS
jgi:amino acid permease